MEASMVSQAVCNFNRLIPFGILEYCEATNLENDLSDEDGPESICFDYIFQANRKNAGLDSLSEMIKYDMIYDVIRYDTIRCGMIWHDMTWHGVTWFDALFFSWNFMIKICNI